ncbi:MAG: biopolymer transporter ExbD [Verrucomicrobiae bacterium]|nr:biopolymer transporter ExbD [Verrucomicrobiae bacterium]
MKLSTSISIVKGPLDVVPLVNVVFLLLLFFMLSSVYLTQPGVPVVLSEAILGSATSANRRVITLAANGEVYFDDQKLAWEQVGEALRRYNQENPNAALILKADVSVAHGSVMYVMREALMNHIEVVLATQKE